MNELTRRCLALSKEDKADLINLLKESLKEGKEDGSRFSVLLRIATEVCGEGILSRSRDFKCVMGRRCIAYRMRLEGFSLQQIARRLNMNHSSVVHMHNMMKDVLQYPNIFELDMAYWEEFEKKVHEYDTNERTAQGS